MNHVHKVFFLNIPYHVCGFGKKYMVYDWQHVVNGDAFKIVDAQHFFAQRVI